MCQGDKAWSTHVGPTLLTVNVVRASVFVDSCRPAFTTCTSYMTENPWASCPSRTFFVLCPSFAVLLTREEWKAQPKRAE